MCQQGSGFQLCEKPEPVTECPAYRRGFNAMSSKGSIRGGRKCGEIRVYWNGVRIPAETGTPIMDGRVVTGYIFEGYRYERSGNPRDRGYGSCSGKVYSDPGDRAVCRTPIE